MSDIISVLVVDDNIKFCDMLCKYIDNTGDINVAGIAMNGVNAIEMIKAQKPDVVILDIILPEIDGIGVLERTQDISPDKRPVFIVLSAIGKELVIQKAVELGADYYVIKPFDIEMLIKYIRMLHAERKAMRKAISHRPVKPAYQVHETVENRTERIIAGLIKRMGITPNVAGYRYLREAAALAVNQPALLNSVVRLIYPVLAEKHNTTVKGIDKAIRCAIDSGYKKMKNKGILDTPDSNQYRIMSPLCREKLSNTRLIAFLADKARQLMEGDSNALWNGAGNRRLNN
ncbi:MAG: sporulation transcription factor Spo0A [Acetivibrionales bacterium]|jgi:two-component system response regulator (stage 0 sporulation protein A)